MHTRNHKAERIESPTKDTTLEVIEDPSPASITTKTVADLQFTSNIPPDRQSCSDQLPPPMSSPGVPWDLEHPPAITSYLEGPHFSYDHTSAFNYSMPVTPESYQTLLTSVEFASEINIGRNISFFKSLIPLNSEEREDQRHIVLSRDTSFVLELSLKPGPGHCLAFDALEIPGTQSTNPTVLREERPLLSLQILLVDAATDMSMQVRAQDQQREEGEIVVPSLVEFQTECNIIDPRYEEAIIRFKLPCCFLGSMHRTGRYRICVALHLDDKQVGLWRLPGIFEVAHMDEKLVGGNRQYPKEVETICKGSLDQSPHNYCCIAHRKQHSNCYSIIGRCFERAFSLALELDRVAVSFISDHEIYRRTLYSLVPAVRQQLRDAIQLEYDHIIRILARARFDTTMLRTQYEVAVSLTRLIAPIHWLPVELLESIFSLIPDEQNHKIDTLMHTCRRWKAVISSIWSPLKLGTWTPLDKVKAILDGENGLVSVTIDPSGDAIDRPIGSLEADQYASLMLAASTSTSRWRTLDILSLPDSRQYNAPFEDQSHATHAVPMNHLRSLSIPIHHDSSRFLDLLLPSIGATTSAQLQDMHLRSVQAMLYLAQPHCAQVFNHLTSFRCFLPRTDAVIEVLPHFWHLEILEVSGLRFPTYGTDIELPLTKTLRHMSLRTAAISWMNNRNFLRLEFCTIVSPLESESAPITNLPLCGEFYFNGPRFDAIKYFCIPSFCHLTLCSPQWSKSRGNDQLSHLWGASNDGALQPTTLHLHLTCASEQLLQALCFMPQLKELVLKLDHPTALGSRFFKGCLRQTSNRTEPLQPCPSLEVLGLKYQRWFRQGEPNEMPALVAMALLNKQDREIWVETDRAGQERIHISPSQISAPILCSLGLLQLIDGVEPPSELVDEVIRAALTILSPVNITFSHRKIMMHLSPSIYSCLFRHLRNFAVHADVDQEELFEVLAHFERLEGLYLATLSPSSSQPHLPLLRTLKRLHLGTTSLFWMEGCTFTKLEELEIQRITEEEHGQFQHVQMPMCKFASFPQSLSSASLNAFQMPRLHKLDLHGLDCSRESVYPAIQQFRLQAASFCFTNSLAVQEILEMQPELEVLEIRESKSAYPRIETLPELLGILLKPYKMSGRDSLDHNDRSVEPPGQEMPLCPRLKELKLALVEDREWKLVEELAQMRRERQVLEEQERKEPQWRPEVREMRRKQMWRRTRVWEMELLWGNEQVGDLERVERRILELELARVLEKGQNSTRGEYARRCQKFMRHRMEKGYPLQRCQLAWGSHQKEILNELIGLKFPDMPND